MACYQVIYDIKTKFNPQLDNENKLTYLAILVGLNTQFNWLKASLKWKTVYQYKTSNNKSIPNKN